MSYESAKYFELGTERKERRFWLEISLFGINNDFETLFLYIDNKGRIARYVFGLLNLNGRDFLMLYE